MEKVEEREVEKVWERLVDNVGEIEVEKVRDTYQDDVQKAVLSIVSSRLRSHLDFNLRVQMVILCVRSMTLEPPDEF